MSEGALHLFEYFVLRCLMRVTRTHIKIISHNRFISDSVFEVLRHFSFPTCRKPLGKLATARVVTCARDVRYTNIRDSLSWKWFMWMQSDSIYEY
jgi:hypothetical protein